MMELNGITASLVFISSLLLLAYSSDWFTEGSAKVARRIGVSKFIIGVIVVGFGTSLPEFATSVYASLIGSSGVAVGNVVGSNIANIALVLGLSCLLRPVIVRREELKEGAISLSIMLLASILLLHNRDVARIEGLILLSLFALYLRYALKNPANHRAPQKETKILGAALRVLAGLAGVLLGSIFLVRSAIVLARLLGVPESVIGLTMVAFGTSVPELAVAIAAARKGYVTMLLGNILGSNIMNMLLVLGAASLVMPLVVEVEIATKALPMMLFLSLLLAVFMKTGGEIRRGEGLILLGLYALFLWLTFS
jgi:cation:H+ antiporter